MQIKRKEDGSVSIKDDNGVTVIGRVIGTSNDECEEKFQQWVQDCAKLVTAHTHTFKETEQYFLEQCDALPLDLNDKRMQNIKLNVIMNHYKDRLEHQASEFSFDMTDEEIEKWHKEQDAMYKEIMNSSPERFGLVMRGYYLPHTERNEIFYEQDYHELQKLMKHRLKQTETQDICIFFEETTEHCQSSGGNALMLQLIVFKGISEEDIEKCTPRYLGYISTLRDMGKLPDFK